MRRITFELSSNLNDNTSLDPKSVLHMLYGIFDYNIQHPTLRMISRPLSPLRFEYTYSPHHS